MFLFRCGLIRSTTTYYGIGSCQLHGEDMLEQFLVLNGAWSASGGPYFWALSSGRPVWESAGRRPSYVSRRHASLVGMHLSGMRLLRACISYRVPQCASLTDMYLIGVHLMGVPLMGVHLVGVHPIGVHLISVHVIGYQLHHR
jgi:hypothetical protein